jgi:hypothetical protein
MSGRLASPTWRTPSNQDEEFFASSKEVAERWMRIGELYPRHSDEALLPEKLSIGQFEQGYDSNCFLLVALAALVEHRPELENVFVTRKPADDGRYVFRFFRDGLWIEVTIDDRIPLTDDSRPTHIESPTSRSACCRRGCTLRQRASLTSSREPFGSWLLCAGCSEVVTAFPLIHCSLGLERPSWAAQLAQGCRRHHTFASPPGSGPRKDHATI